MFAERIILFRSQLLLEQEPCFIPIPNQTTPN